LVNAFDSQNDNIRKTNSIKFDIGVSDTYWTDKNNYPFAYKQRIQDGTQHIYILRYADMILLKAEAKVNLNLFSEAEALINQVRSRVNLPNVATITSKDDGINKILKERLLELAFEGQRWFDLKRTGKALEVIKARTNGKGNQLSYVNNLTELIYLFLLFPLHPKFLHILLQLLYIFLYLLFFHQQSFQYIYLH
jgi:hypothetical protein